MSAGGMTDNRTTELVSYREVRTLLTGFLCEYQNILLSRGINASEAVCKQNELIDKYAERIEQAVAATLGSGECDTRWHKLFGTPERAARTMHDIPCGNKPCTACPIYEPCIGKYSEGHYDPLLEWLRGKGES